MTEHIQAAAFSLIVLLVLEAGIWSKVCFGAAFHHESLDFTRLMFRAPYRPLWWPKLVVELCTIPLFVWCSAYYRGGGEDMRPGTACILLMITFSGLVFWESYRALRAHGGLHLADE